MSSSKNIYTPMPISDLEGLQAHAIQLLEWQKQWFPNQSDFALEVEATNAFRQAAKTCKAVFGATEAVTRLLTGPSGRRGSLMADLSPDWDAVLFAAKLLRYIALCAHYEIRIFSKDQRLARDVREKRHNALLAKYPVQPDWKVA